MNVSEKAILPYPRSVQWSGATKKQICQFSEAWKRARIIVDSGGGHGGTPPTLPTPPTTPKP
jgi:hypothetical protein